MSSLGDISVIKLINTDYKVSNAENIVLQPGDTLDVL